MIILPIISPKGGEGKSTHAANLAGFFADAGLRVLLIDADYSQPTASSIFPLSYEAPAGLYELLMQTVDLRQPEQIISRSVIKNLDILISNDPDELLPTAMLHAPDGRLRLRNVLQHPLFSQYDIIFIDSKGATGVMSELVVLAATQGVLGVIKPILPDVREFLRGTLRMLIRLRPFENYGIRLPAIRILVNGIEGTNLDRDTLSELADIINNQRYDASALGGRQVYQLLETRIDLLDIYKLGHVRAQPVHRLEYKTSRKSPAAAQTMHRIACELVPLWAEKFDAVLTAQPTREAQ
ncbi:ParA family protein [Xenorhabdus bovienii]|uniref:ParA family protein n=1 Tax=Xenorhabdus bovienii TaxID=40576 RepID=UPI00237CB476|nr:ParA family protein [Xenorhabdus bovienii]MDE1486589.1 ParA family protein [Xenorhabdus bovienii]MDE1496437.1 ParA family protein [Xenorhabdus bovienii]MDE9447170.1 ParA family protein [Xenorhabdus bovienii]MDE9474411.1 ParA family protein [Xenorhabdus bovienii]MDE9477209.1 ParA family protein [Xenorhabdus bovienii]